MKFKEFITNPYLRLIPGGIILIIIVGGSIQSYLDFFKNNMWLNVAVVVFSIAYLIILNYEKLRVASARTPEIDENFFVSSEIIKMEKLNNRSELVAMYNLAREAFGTDAMTLEKIKELHWPSKDTVFLLKNESGDIVGYLALFFPKLELKEKIFAGDEFSLNPMNWTNQQFYTGEKTWFGTEIYMESIVVKGKGPRERIIRSKFLIREALEEVLDNLKDRQGEIHVFGFVGSEAGRNLKNKSLKLNLVRKAEDEEQMDLMHNYLTVAEIRKVWLNIDMELISQAHQEKDYRIFK